MDTMRVGNERDFLKAMLSKFIFHFSFEHFHSPFRTRAVWDSVFVGQTPNLKCYRYTTRAWDPNLVVKPDPQTPETHQTTGARHFYLDSSDNIIHVNATRPASKDDPVL